MSGESWRQGIKLCNFCEAHSLRCILHICCVYNTFVVYNAHIFHKVSWKRRVTLAVKGTTFEKIFANVPAGIFIRIYSHVTDFQYTALL